MDRPTVNQIIAELFTIFTCSSASSITEHHTHGHELHAVHSFYSQPHWKSHYRGGNFGCAFRFSFHFRRANWQQSKVSWFVSIFVYWQHEGIDSMHGENCVPKPHICDSLDRPTGWLAWGASSSSFPKKYQIVSPVFFLDISYCDSCCHLSSSKASAKDCSISNLQRVVVD